MDRVLVIGCCGAGKSTFARRLAAITGLPLVHLDQQYWQPGWVESEKAAWVARVEQLVAEPRWIMDGNYAGTLPLRLARADAVIVLDLPRWLCLWRVVQRTLRHFGRTRVDMTENCPERFDWEFMRYVWNYRRDHQPRVLQNLESFRGLTIRCDTPAAAAAFLQRAGAGPTLSEQAK